MHYDLLLLIIVQEWCKSSDNAPWLWQRLVGVAKSQKPLPWTWQTAMPAEGSGQPHGGTGWDRLTYLRSVSFYVNWLTKLYYQVYL